MTMKNISVPRPTVKEVEKYLRRWNNLKDYKAQEDALDKLFFKLCPQNVDESDILLKVASLNDFYSTNIFSVFPVAERILKCVNVDERLNKGDETLVMDIQKVSFIKEKTKEKVNRYFYSFATKYCSHHRPLLYPIYDSYVDAVLRYFRNRDSFESFSNDDLKDYSKFKMIILKFRDFYKLNQFNIKELDKYLWLLGKKYFPKSY